MAEGEMVRTNDSALSTDGRPERAILVGLYSDGRQRARAEESLDELEELAKSAGAIVVDRVLQEREQPDRAYFVGKGKIEELGLRVPAEAIDLLIFDDNLTPAQKAHIADAVKRKAIDRTELILDIFARRARTKEGKIQVELAQLQYLLPRLRGKGEELSRLGGGIGTRGPGETKLEADRRRIKRRIQILQRELKEIEKQRRLHRLRREEADLPIIALVGYTNAGKSTLFNTLTKADAPVSNRLFATLDPLVRRLRLPDGQEALLSDTVGFIRKLPHQLVAAFRATLEEVVESDLLLHVIDVSEEDCRERMAAVEEVLEELGADGIRRINIFNKIDLLDPDRAARLLGLKSLHPDAVSISALTGQGIDELLQLIAEKLSQRIRLASFKIPYSQANLVDELHRRGKVISQSFGDDGIRVVAEAPRSLVERNRRFLAEQD